MARATALAQGRPFQAREFRDQPAGVRRDPSDRPEQARRHRARAAYRDGGSWRDRVAVSCPPARPSARASTSRSKHDTRTSGDTAEPDGSITGEALPVGTLRATIMTARVASAPAVRPRTAAQRSRGNASTARAVAQAEPRSFLQSGSSSLRISPQVLSALDAVWRGNPDASSKPARKAGSFLDVRDDLGPTPVQRKNASMALAARRPSSIAQTMSDWPRCMSPAANTPGTLVIHRSSRHTV